MWINIHLKLFSQRSGFLAVSNTCDYILQYLKQAIYMAYTMQIYFTNFRV